MQNVHVCSGERSHGQTYFFLLIKVRKEFIFTTIECQAPGHFFDGHFFDGHFFDGHFFDGTYFRRDIFLTSNKMGHIFDMTFSIKILLTNLT